MATCLHEFVICEDVICDNKNSLTTIRVAVKNSTLTTI